MSKKTIAILYALYGVVTRQNTNDALAICVASTIA